MLQFLGFVKAPKDNKKSQETNKMADESSEFKYCNLVKEENMKNEFPKYYKSENRGMVYKVTSIDHVDIERHEIYCVGTLVRYWPEYKKIESECIFDISEYAYEISEEEFNKTYLEIADKMNYEKFPQYFYYPTGNTYFKFTRKEKNRVYGYTYYGISANRLDLTINGISKISEFELKNGSCIPCSKDEYEKAFNDVIERVK